MARVAPRRCEFRPGNRARARTLDRICLRLCSGLGADFAIYDRDDVSAALRRSGGVPFDRFIDHGRSGSIHTLYSISLRPQYFGCHGLVRSDLRDLLHRRDSVRRNGNSAAALCFSRGISAAFRSPIRT